MLNICIFYYYLCTFDGQFILHMDVVEGNTIFLLFNSNRVNNYTIVVITFTDDTETFKKSKVLFVSRKLTPRLSAWLDVAVVMTSPHFIPI